MTKLPVGEDGAEYGPDAVELKVYTVAPESIHDNKPWPWARYVETVILDPENTVFSQDTRARFYLTPRIKLLGIRSKSIEAGVQDVTTDWIHPGYYHITVQIVDGSGKEWTADTFVIRRGGISVRLVAPRAPGKGGRPPVPGVM